MAQPVVVVGGPTGPSGGPTGTTGPSGLTGATGPTGFIGPTGIRGFTGPTGAPGVTAFTGPTGAIGPPGSFGATGQVGSQGPTGPTGNPGAAVTTNYNSGLSRSVTGTSTWTTVGAQRAITPAVTGRVFIWASGMAYNNTVGGATNIGIMFGTGATPAPGSTPSGTLPVQVVFIASTTAGRQGFALVANPSLSVNTTYWFEIVITSPSSNTGGVEGCQLLVMEL
jgi:collagen type VII alpha